jgi:enterochelin esterase-like enzyme
MTHIRHVYFTLACSLILGAVSPTMAQEAGITPPAQLAMPGGGGPVVVSPEVSADRHVILRIYAPGAQKVTAPSFGVQAAPTPLVKGSNGIWEATIGPVDPGAYRYNFNVDGATVVDSRNLATERMQVTVRSILYVPGAAFMDERDVPHGNVEIVTYYSSVLKKFREIHVYTPPGYGISTKKYPVLYLLHGANESDDSWHTVGRMGFILDNLIADGKAVPMIVVMTNGHTDQIPPRVANPPSSAAIAGGAAVGTRRKDDFPAEFEADILPYAESHFRIIGDRQDRAIAGLSMGGSQTLNISFTHPDQFSSIGVFSSGILGGNNIDTWEQEHLSALDNPAMKKGLKMLWFSTGSDDPLLPTSKATVAMFNKHGFKATFQESTGAHTWINWRNYFFELAPQLFR